MSAQEHAWAAAAAAPCWLADVCYNHPAGGSGGTMLIVAPSRRAASPLVSLQSRVAGGHVAAQRQRYQLSTGEERLRRRRLMLADVFDHTKDPASPCTSEINKEM